MSLRLRCGVSLTAQAFRSNGVWRASKGTRQLSSGADKQWRQALNEKNRLVAIYTSTLAVLILGVAYASVPLYKIFCQVTGFGGTTKRADTHTAAAVAPVEGSRLIRVTFMAEVHDAMPWKFRPTQTDIRVAPGETALAFYTVSNPSDQAITGVATYNVFPPRAGQYFIKVQCFCFEEQRLSPHEEVDMPVFFYLDPKLLKDASMDTVNNITLSYTFFKTDDEEYEENEPVDGKKQAVQSGTP